MFPQHQVDIDIPSRILAEARIRDFFSKNNIFALLKLIETRNEIPALAISRNR